MPNTSQPSQRPTPGNYSGFETAPGAEFVLFENSASLEVQPITEVSPILAEPTPLRVVKGGIPLAEIARGPVVPTEVLSARRAVQVSGVIRQLREDAVQRGLRHAS